MKKIFALLICTVLLLCAFPFSAFAEGDSIGGGEPIAEEVVTSPTTEENAAESVISGDAAMSETSSERVVEYIKLHFEEMSVVVGLILSGLYQSRKNKLIGKTVVTTNNNAVEISRNSEKCIQQALDDMREMTTAVASYKEELSSMLAEVRESAEEKRKLEEALDKTLSFIKAAKLANVELGNEVAELLVLANIPNAKKEELYSRHRVAVGAISDADTEVIAHDYGTKE